MFSCPRCQVPQARTVVQGRGVFWSCPSCGGRSLTVSALRTKLDRQYVNRIWQAARASETSTALPCPMCQNGMREVAALAQPTSENGEALHVDVCLPCHQVWFDVGELDTAKAVAGLAVPETEVQLHPKAREAVAMAQIALIRSRAEAEDSEEGRPPDCVWRTLITLFGVPVEENPSPLSRWPIVTFLTVFLMALVTFFTLKFQPELLPEWGLLPEDAFRHHGLTFFSSFFLHASWLHLLGNGLFLLVFGMKIEDRFGHLGLLLLLLLATLAGDFLHMAFDPRGDVVCVGASGGIAGVLALFALLFPNARLVTMIRFGLFIRWIRFPAWVGLAFWVLWEAITVATQVAGRGDVSGLAHVGGLGVGIVWGLAVKMRERFAQESPA